MKCFVIMPFGDEKRDPQSRRQFDHIYEHWIKPAVEAVTVSDGSHLECHRGDSDNRPGEIIRHVVEGLSESDMVIADLTGRNANVFYELGVRHALRDNTVIIAQDLDDIPFDLRGLRAIPYRYDPESLVGLRTELGKTLCALMKEAIVNDNPVRRYLYERQTKQLIETAEPTTQHVLREMRAELDQARRDFSEQIREVRMLAEIATRHPAKRNASAIDIERFEGAWASQGVFSVLSIFASHFYAKFINGELRVAYCYEGNDELTGYFYNVMLVGDRIVGRFKWFKKHIEGCVLLHEQSNDQLKGGWWYLDDMPESVRGNLLEVDERTPAMISLRLVRLSADIVFPKWATDYFYRIESEASSA
jgi:hypothetical protein